MIIKYRVTARAVDKEVSIDFSAIEKKEAIKAWNHFVQEHGNAKIICIDLEDIKNQS